MKYFLVFVLIYSIYSCGQQPEATSLQTIQNTPTEDIRYEIPPSQWNLITYEFMHNEVDPEGKYTVQGAYTFYINETQIQLGQSIFTGHWKGNTFQSYHLGEAMSSIEFVSPKIAIMRSNSGTVLCKYTNL